MNDEPNTSLESAYRGVNRGLMARIQEQDKELLFLRWYGIGITMILILVTALKCR